MYSGCVGWTRKGGSGEWMKNDGGYIYIYNNLISTKTWKSIKIRELISHSNKI
jgi:hypothetical protein